MIYCKRAIVVFFYYFIFLSNIYSASLDYFQLDLSRYKSVLDIRAPFLTAQLADVNRLTIERDPLGSIEKVLKLSILPQDKVAHKNRAEIVFKFNEQSGDVSNYYFSLFIPKSFKESLSVLGRFNMIAQIHTRKGDNLRQKPSFVILYNEQNDSLNIKYGIPKEKIGSVKISRGSWHKIRVNIGWSLNKDGFVKVFLDNQLVAFGKGANMYEDFPHLFKIGLYRGSPSSFLPINTIYFKDIQWRKN